ncbi:HAAS signaling domain-containing protein [Bacillus sp. DJP31]|uniref:HAAS signaling domain-containing protein n=1 Tax=Bacillus sp. DJP31 TaxID=3409789 RepID=UPI003BB68F74
MTPKTKEEYLTQLERMLPSTINKKEVLQEWDIHFDDAMEEYSIETVIGRLGKPVEIAAAYRESIPIHKNWIAPFYIGCNSLFFILGSLITIAYKMTDHPLAQTIWHSLVTVAPVIMGGYLLFWVYLGYEIGRTYGVKGYGLLTKTVLLTILPNILLMLLTLFNWIPAETFSPLLTPIFVFFCILFTFLVYPISRLAFKAGLSRSLL